MLPLLQPFFSFAGKQSEVSRRSSLGTPMVKRKHVVSFRDNAYLWDKIIRVTLKVPVSTRDSQVWPWEERNEKSGWYSVQHASGNREYTRKVVQNIKDQLRHDESISEISINSEEMHISIWTRFTASSMQAALHMDPSYENNLELFKNSEFENIKGLFGITRMMIEGNSEIYFPQTLRVHFGKICIASRTSNKADKSKSVRLLGLRVVLAKTARSRRCSKKAE